MIIYPLPPAELDDKTLSRQIRNIAQVLCNVHHADIACLTDIKKIEEASAKIPLPQKRFAEDKICWWARECRANYLKLVDMGYKCMDEYVYRFNDYPDFGCGKNFLLWAVENVPDLPYGKIDKDCLQCDNDEKGSYGQPCDTHAWGTATPFPLVMPDKYIIFDCDFYEPTAEICIIESYRNYYRAKIKNKLADFVSDEQDKEIALFRKLQMAGVKFTRREKPERLNDL
jgi:hypothetical protein